MNARTFFRLLRLLCTLTTLPTILAAQADRTHEKDFFQAEIGRYEAAFRRSPDGAASTTALDMTYYRLNIAVTTTPQYLSGSVLMNGRSTQDALASVTLDLMNSMTIDSVKVAGVPAQFAQSAAAFTVTLDRSYDTGEPLSIEVFYRGKPGSSGFGSFAFSTHGSTPWVWSLSEPYGAKDWWPSSDHPSDKADSADIIVTCDAAYKVGSNGKLLSVTENGDGTHTYHWHEGHPVSTYLISVAITNFASFSNWFRYTPTDSMEILNYVLPEHLASAMSQLPVVASELRIYSDLFGLYPFIDEKYGHSEFGWGGGMEHQTMTSLGGFGDGLTAHELAHQWFGDLITCRTWPDVWLNEGFATFCEHLYERAQYGETSYWAGIASNMTDAKTVTQSVYVNDSASVGSLFNWSRVYAKGSVTLHMLRRVLGDSTFFRSMYNYANDPRLRFANASTRDFQAVCESTSGKPLSYFFDEWIYGTRYPRYTSSWTADSLAGGYNVTIGLRQTTGTLTPSFFTMPVDIRLLAPGWDTTVTVTNNASAQTFTVSASHRPTSVQIDPGMWILCDKDTLREFAAAPAALNFGPVYVSGAKSDSVTVRNTGLVPLVIRSAASDDPSFSVAPGSATIAPASSRVFLVTFHPSAQGARSAHLVFLHNAERSPATVSVSGSTMGYAIARQWNLVSLPVAVADPRVTTLYPWATMPAYRYDGAPGYAAAESLEAGTGYWIKSDSARVIAIDGTERVRDTLEVRSGWNLVGSVSLPVAVADILSDPPGMITSRFFGYQGGYAPSDTILPGRAYWMKSDGEGVIVIGSAPSDASKSARIRPLLASEDLPPPPGEGGPPSNSASNLSVDLRQNYPNPFNSRTVISYWIPSTAQVKITLCDLLGRTVAVLVDEVRGMGRYSVSYDAAALPSGVYIYRLSAGNAAIVKRMMLLR